MLYIGDVHGHIEQYLAIIRLETGPSIQLGDMGAGFVQVPGVPIQHKFIRGNHDAPDICHFHANYLGDYGYVNAWRTFYLSGAYSPDKDTRTIGVDWWPNEELSYQDLMGALDIYKDVKPQIVVSHDCPLDIAALIPKTLGHPDIKSRTGFALQQMFELHQPKHWIFGHYHVSWNTNIKGTQFVCLNELETYRLD